MKTYIMQNPIPSHLNSVAMEVLIINYCILILKMTVSSMDIGNNFCFRNMFLETHEKSESPGYTSCQELTSPLEYILLYSFLYIFGLNNDFHSHRNMFYNHSNNAKP